MDEEFEKESKPQYKINLCYDEEFKPQLDMFLRNIVRDPRFADKNPRINKQRFSKAIRYLIVSYNNAIAKATQSKKEVKDGTST